ncbi:hypothetical protein CP985_10895 [Malaciobacter mytili LMG 24559]|uniref:Uncharacterized protein n=1 Tax=Malaciobacter mytili LMG 24559 TaxID=1032238 RepID=A0AAX2AFQ0_9BACT|nr:hypothetical protein [Malaciobacter mytili]AXH16304.1 hypothetical protein AMYT_a0004 [Malaciobacter mytili LMG 24559]RXK14970.1 hypothetical protein CP985_10895 [Malaciobacter mytili LMG 24559]
MIKAPKTKSQVFKLILNLLLPTNTDIKKISNGYSTIRHLKECGSEAIYDVKSDIVRITKLSKEYVGSTYEDTTESKRYKVISTKEKMILKPL